MIKSRIAVVSVVGVALVLAGCQTGDPATSVPPTLATPLSQAVDIAAMVSNHTAHTGDNNKVLAVLDATHPEVIGMRRIALETEKEPFALEIPSTAWWKGLRPVRCRRPCGSVPRW